MMPPLIRFVSRLITLLLILCLLAVTNGQEQKNAGVAKRVLLISLDGLDARYLSRRDELGLKIPTLRRLIAEGVTARAGVVGVYPSLTYPSHTTLVTGAFPSRHGIFGNEVFDPFNPSTNAGIWFARDIKVQTLWDAATRNRLSCGMVSWPVAGGAGDWNVPEIWKPDGETKQDDLKEMTLNARPQGLVEEVEKHAGTALYAQVTKDEQDDMRTRFAEYVIAEKRPDVMLVHLFDFDHFQHDFGPFTPEAIAVLEKEDAYLARLLAAYERAGTLSETAVFIVSDHGFLPVSQRINPGVLLAQAGLLKPHEEVDEGGRRRVVVTEWRAAAYPTAGSCAIILRDPADTDALERARRVLKNYPPPQMGARPVYRVIEAGEVRRLGANTRAALMLEAAEGYSFGKNVTGDVITANDKRGQHGYLPTTANYRASFIAVGAGVTRRGDMGEIRMIDIGPTIAKALGLKLKDADGHTLALR